MKVMKTHLHSQGRVFNLDIKYWIYWILHIILRRVRFARRGGPSARRLFLRTELWNGCSFCTGKNANLVMGRDACLVMEWGLVGDPDHVQP